MVQGPGDRDRAGGVEDARARLVAPDARGLVLHGDPGIGKTTLLRAIAADLRTDGWEVVTVRTSASTSVPYAAVLELLPTDAAGSLVEVLRAGLDHLATRDGPSIAVIDDLQDLDDASFTLIDAALDRGLLTLLATCRDGTDSSARTKAWARRHGCSLVAVPPLKLEETADLAARLAGGRIGAVTAARIQASTGGNPLHIEEVVHLGLSTAALYPDPDGTFRARADLPLAPSLLELVHDRLHALPPPMRRAGEILALAQPLQAIVLQRVAVDRHIVDNMIRSGVITATPDGFTLHHPLHAEALLAGLPDPRRRQHLQRLLDAVGTDPHPDRILQIRLAAWQLELGGTVPPQTRRQAARTAMSVGDLDLAEELLADLDSPEATLIRAEIASVRSQPEQALSLLDEAAPASEQERASIALVRSQIQLIALGDPNGAAATLGMIDRSQIAPSTASEVRAAQALLLLLAGETRAAASLADEVTHETPTASQVATLVSTSIAEVLLGDLGRARAQGRRGLELIPELPAPAVLPFAEVQLGCSITYAELYDGRIAAALERCRHEQQSRIHRGGAVAALWTSMRGHAELLAGNLHVAHDVASDAVAMTRAADPLGHGGLTMADQALAAASLGDAQRTADLLEQLHHRPDADSPRVAVNIARVEAWHRALRGELSTAVEVAIAGARRAADSGYRSWALFAAHDAVRLGSAGMAVELLTELRPSVPPTSLLRRLVEHGLAAAAEDADGLEEVARTLTTQGATLLAAEAYLHASAAAQRRDQLRRATRLRRQAAEIGPPDAWTLTGGAPVPELTARERQIAQLAAKGRSNRSIAEHLVVSVRTVENHLAAVYHKLGLRNRQELADLLGV